MENTNIYNEKEYKDIAKWTLNTISDSLCNSLGYYGSNTIIEDKLYGHIVTKDGYTILNKIKFDNTVSNTLLEIVKNISRDLVREVGDGSTSSIVIANELFNGIDKLSKKNNYPMKLILEDIKEIEELLEDKIIKESIPITEENFEVIKNIATISNNNDEELGNMIYEIYKKIGKEGFIYIEKALGNESYYEILNGIELSRGYVNKIFVNQPNKRECIFNEPFILMCNDRLDSTDLNLLVDLIGTIASQQMKPLVIIANSFSVEFVNCMEINKRQNPNLQISLVDFSFSGKQKEEMFDDIATFINAKIYNKKDNMIPDNFIPLLGKCDKIVMTESSTKIIGRKGSDQDINDRVKSIEEDIERVKSIDNPNKVLDEELFILEKRKANLLSKIVRFFVGGDTELEKENRKYLVEDSVFACKSALIYGYVMGGNLTIPSIIKKYNLISNSVDVNKLLYQIIANSFLKCYKKVINNSGIYSKEETEKIVNECVNENKILNLKTNSYENINDTKVLNSSMTEIKIMKSVFSIIGLLATSNQFLSNNINKKFDY